MPEYPEDWWWVSGLLALAVLFAIFFALCWIAGSINAWRIRLHAQRNAALGLDLWGGPVDHLGRAILFDQDGRAMDRELSPILKADGTPMRRGDYPRGVRGPT